MKGINAGGRVGSYHPRGANVGFFDGFVSFLSNDTPPETLRAGATIAGGESVDLYGLY